MELTLDEDGYPSEEAQVAIQTFPVTGNASAIELIEAIKEIWWMPDWGFIWDGKHKLALHTGGWSGNEAIIYVLKQNIFWSLYWKAEFVGGHYHFELQRNTYATA